MKVVFVAPYALPMSIGGFQGQVYHIYNELQNLGVDVSWYTFDTDKIREADILQVMATDSSMLSMIKRAKNSGVKVVLTPMQGSRMKSNKYLKTALALSKIPQLCSMHKLTAETIQCADHLTPLCSFEADRMNEVYGVSQNRITVIPNGIDSTFLAGNPMKTDLPFDNYILIVGRIEENKNQINLIRACNELNQNLIIVGEPGSEGSSYMESCKSLSGKNIYYWGLEKNPLVLKFLYQNAAATAIPSYSEMVPLVAFESLSQKTPVLCTDRCGINGDDVPGLIYTDISKDALKRAIIETLKFDRLLITDKGVFSWSDIANQYLSVYHKVLNN